MKSLFAELFISITYVACRGYMIDVISYLVFKKKSTKDCKRKANVYYK